MEEQQDRGQAPQLTDEWIRVELEGRPLAHPHGAPLGLPQAAQSTGNGQQPLSLDRIPLGISALQLLPPTLRHKPLALRHPLLQSLSPPCPLTVQSRTARTFRALTDDVLVGISVPEAPMQSGKLAGRHGWMRCGRCEGRGHCQRRRHPTTGSPILSRSVMAKLLSWSRLVCGGCPNGSPDGYLPLICPRWRLIKLGRDSLQPLFRGRSS